MSYIPLTNAGKAFIGKAVNANTNNLSGSQKYPLGRSNVAANTTFNSAAKYKNVAITTNDDLISGLISWINTYSETYFLDANIIAAQTYLLSNYALCTYSDEGSVNKSSAMGITQLMDSSIYDIYFNKMNDIDTEDQAVFDTEYATISLNLSGDLSDVRSIIPYRTDSNDSTNTTALENRRQLFQNIINNPELMIKILCRVMHDLGTTNNNLAASSLLGYVLDRNLKSKTYNEAINSVSKNNANIHLGTNFVTNVFKILSGTYKKELGGFGYKVDFTENDSANMNLSNTIILTGDYGLNIMQEKLIQQLHPQVQDKFRQLIFTIEKTTPFKVKVNSTYRSFQLQNNLKNDYAVSNPTVPVSPPGRSYHQYGLAVDMSLNNPNNPKDRYSHNKTRQDWVDTGVPQIATDLGFVWGGDFTNYDPVHFDLSNTYALNALYQSCVNQFGSDPNKIVGNQIRNLQPSTGGYA